MRPNRFIPATEATRTYLTREVGASVSGWALATAGLQRITVVPGEYFVLTRDLLVYPHGSFLAAGIFGLVGNAGVRYRRDLPFAGLAVYPQAFMDPYTLVGLHTATPRNPNFWQVEAGLLAVRDYILRIFGLYDGKGRVAGARQYRDLVARGSLAPAEDWARDPSS